MTPELAKLREELRSLNERRVYFLLSAGGAGLGFAVTQMNDLVPSPAIWILLASLALTSLSILAGLRALGQEAMFLFANRVYLELVDQYQGTPITPSEVMRVAKERFNSLNSGMILAKRVQTGSLLLGALLLPAWKLAQCSGCLNVLVAFPTR